jgi:hypothetical protein
MVACRIVDHEAVHTLRILMVLFSPLNENCNIDSAMNFCLHLTPRFIVQAALRQIIYSLNGLCTPGQSAASRSLLLLKYVDLH